jgi:hypothetical protein
MSWLILRDSWITNDNDYVPFFVIIIWSFPHWWLIIRFVTRVTRQILQVGQELLILPEHMSSFPVFARSVFFCIVFAHHCVSVCLFVFRITTLITTLISSSCTSLSYAMVFVVIVRCFNTAESVDHHRLNFPFIA